MDPSGQQLKRLINIVMELVKYRDSGMNTYTWFWVDSQQRIASPFFDTDIQAQEWLEQMRLRAEARKSSDPQ